MFTKNGILVEDTKNENLKILSICTTNGDIFLQILCKNPKLNDEFTKDKNILLNCEEIEIMSLYNDVGSSANEIKSK